MIAHPFRLERPRSLEDALHCLRQHGSGCRPLAGGTVLVPELSHGRSTPSVVVDLKHADIDGIRLGAESLDLGATVTYRQLLMAAATNKVSRSLSWLCDVARGITGGGQIRNRGTLGGSAAYANPSSDVPALLVALDATLTAASVRGRRELAAGEFFADAFRTRLADDELLVSIRIPALEDRTRFGYEKLKFHESSWPIVTAAAVVRPTGSVRLALGGCCPVPVALELEDVSDVLDAVEPAVVEAWSDALASAAYRRRVAPVVARRAVERACAN